MLTKYLNFVTVQLSIEIIIKYIKVICINRDNYPWMLLNWGSVDTHNYLEQGKLIDIKRKQIELTTCKW